MCFNVSMIYKVILITIVIGCLVLTFFKEKKNKNLFAFLCIVIALPYVYLMLQMTLFGRVRLTEHQCMLTPFLSYYSILTGGWNGLGQYVFYGLLGNVLVFIPIGMLVAQLTKVKHKYLISGIIGFLFSLVIEITQYFTLLGTFEVDDLIHNTWGAVIGCSLALALMKKEKNIKANVKTLMPMVVFAALIGSFSLASIIRDKIG